MEASVVLQELVGCLLAIVMVTVAFSYGAQLLIVGYYAFMWLDPEYRSDSLTLREFFICLIPFGILVVFYLRNVQNKKEEQVRKLNAIHIPESNSSSTSAASLY